MFNRMFSKKRPETITKSIRCTKAMWDAITKLANDAGEKPNAYIVYIVDVYLQDQVKKGKIKHPDSVTDEKTAS